MYDQNYFQFSVSLIWMKLIVNWEHNTVTNIFRIIYIYYFSDSLILFKTRSTALFNAVYIEFNLQKSW